MKKFRIKLNKYHLYHLAHIANDYLIQWLRIKDTPKDKEDYGDFKDVADALSEGKYYNYDLVHYKLRGYCQALQLTFDLNKKQNKVSIFDYLNREVYFVRFDQESPNGLIEKYNPEDFIDDLALVGL